MECNIKFTQSVSPLRYNQR